MAVYFTGDIHGQPWDIEDFCLRMELTEEDIIVILGNVKANFHGEHRDDLMKAVLAGLKSTIFCIHGNHKQRPANIPGYELQEWHSGMVWAQKQYPNFLFARDGEIFQIGLYRYLVIGGAYSVDKFYRLTHGYGLWPDEQPFEEIKAYVEKQICEKEFDVILSHTCPYKYEPREMFLASIDQSSVDTSTEKWLDKIEESIGYKAWFCGHWHTDKRIDKMHFLFHSFETEEMI